MPRINVPIIASTMKHPSITCAGTQELSNFYVQPLADYSETRLPMVLKGTPGFSLWKDLSGNLIRGMIVPGDGNLYVVKDNTVYKVTTALVSTSLGTISNSTGQVSMAASQTEVVICNGINEYKITLSNGAFTDITSSFTGINGSFVPTFVFAQNSRFYTYVGLSNQVFISNTLDAATVQSTANIQISINYGKLQNALASTWYQYYMADNTTEIWTDQGASGTVPIVRGQGMTVPVGILAAKSALIIDDMLYFLAKDSSGLIGVVQVQGNTFNIISDYSFLATINDFISITDAYAYVDNWEGHPVYCITFPNAYRSPGYTYNVGYTICYDIMTKIWTEKPSYNSALLRDDRYEAYCSAYFNNNQLIGSYKSGKIFVTSPLVYTENGNTIKRTIVSPHILFHGDLGTVSHLELEVESDEGLVTGQGSTPTVMFQCSKDKGNTYGQMLTRNISAQGKFKQRALWFTLGSARCFTLKFTFSDPIRWVIPAVTADISTNGASGPVQPNQ